MPPRGYANLTVRREVREELEKLAREKGFTTLSDTVAYLLSLHHDLDPRLRRLELAVSKVVETLEQLVHGLEELRAQLEQQREQKPRRYRSEEQWWER